VIGLFVYAVVVARFKSFSATPACLALALIVIPVVIRTTENMLQLVPPPARGGLRPGHAQVEGHHHHAAAARAGVITGVLLAVARIAGETAPLLFTALNNQFWNARPVQTHGQPCRSRSSNLR
jgi:phosphate transport system permease protein